MKFVAQEPFEVISPKPWDNVTMSFFLDVDDVHQEFANHLNNSWHGLEALLDDEQRKHNFDKEY